MIGQSTQDLRETSLRQVRSLPRFVVAIWIFSLVSVTLLLRTIPLRLCVPFVAGVVALMLGSIAYRNAVSNRQGIDRFVVLGPFFIGIPMAVFGGDHFVFANSIAQLIPSWIPWHMFWVLFVGVCLLAGGFSLAVRRYEALAAAMFGVMLLLFVVLMDIPAILQEPRNRIVWSLSFRDLTFGAGALSYGIAHARERWPQSTKILLTLIRFEISIAVIFYGVEHFLHPTFMPGVPDELQTPTWIPLRTPIGYFTGTVLLITGVGLLWEKHAKWAATALGLLLFALVIAFYLPITVAEPSAIDKGLNFLGDTLMFSGSVLCLAEIYRVRPEQI